MAQILTALPRPSRDRHKAEEHHEQALGVKIWYSNQPCGRSTHRRRVTYVTARFAKRLWLLVSKAANDGPENISVLRSIQIAFRKRAGCQPIIPNNNFVL